MEYDQEILLALGSNQALDNADSAQVLTQSIGELAQAGVRILRESRFFQTPCFPAGAGPDYVNAALVVETELPPAQLLALLHRIEADLGRHRKVRWGARTVDIDLIAYGRQVLPNVAEWAKWRDLPLARQQLEAPDQLILPHPRMQDRAFVLVPLMDVAPDWRHPVSGRTVRQMLSDLPEADIKEVRAL